MEPVTHVLTGACLSRAMGMHRRLRYATLTMAIAAEIPDADYVYRLGGPVAYFQHHRGWTHSLLGMPGMALLTLLIVWMWDRLKRFRGREEASLPLRWWPLFGLSLLALCSHLFLDWTNNYGVRPLAPFHPQWFQGEIVFIFEPVIFAVLLLALVLAPIFRLTDIEIGSSRNHDAGQWLARAALLGVLSVWSVRLYEHNKAMEIARMQELPHDASAVKIGLNPMPINPFRWYAVLETPTYYQTGVVDTRNGTMTFGGNSLYWKGAETDAVKAAKASLLGRVYLDWSKDAVVDELALSREEQTSGSHVVRFRDLRFGYQLFSLNGRVRSPLTGIVFVDAQDHVTAMEMNGKQQRP